MRPWPYVFLFPTSADEYGLSSSVKKQLRNNRKQFAGGPGQPGKAAEPAVAGEPAAMSGRTRFQDLFRIDPRSLALFRMAMGALLLVELAVRASDLSAMYTDEGMFPRAEICRRATTIWNWSFHFGSGSWGYQAMLFGLAAALALALLAGFETRLAVIGSWLMLVSIHHRVPPILSGAENLLRMLLFWAMFLPLARAWSVDSWLNKRGGRAARQGGNEPVLSIASAAILLQMGLMYFFSAIYKSNVVWFHGEALAGILAHDFYASPPAAYLLQFPRLLSAMTWGTLALEWAAPVLLFFPRSTAWVRVGMVAALAAMHIGIGICLEVGMFSYVSLAGLTLFLPKEFWNSRALARFLPRPEGVAQPAETHRYIKKRPPLYYATQGVCLMVLIYVFAVNINSFPSHPLAPLTPERWRPLTRGLGLTQSWGMFESIPSKDGWYVAGAKLNDGSEVDLLRNGAAVDWKKPKFPAGLYPNYFWQKLFREMAYDDEQGFQTLRAPVAEFLCRDWNARNSPEKRIAEFKLIYCMQSEDGPMGARVSREQLVHLNLSGP
jgi:hypothetical protein